MLATCGGLLCFVIENVPGVLTEHEGLESAMNKFLRVLRRYLPSFEYRVDTLSLTEDLHRQTAEGMEDWIGANQLAKSEAALEAGSKVFGWNNLGTVHGREDRVHGGASSIRGA